MEFFIEKNPIASIISLDNSKIIQPFVLEGWGEDFSCKLSIVESEWSFFENSQIVLFAIDSDDFVL